MNGNEQGRYEEDWTMDDATATHSHVAGPSGFHPINLSHLIAGVVLACFVGIWAAITLEWLPVDDLRWLLPIPWLVAGSAGLLAATLGRRRRERVPLSDRDVGVVRDRPVDPGP